jgi:hypothetical protein
MPSMTAGMYSLGNGAADDLVENLDAFAAFPGSTLMQAWPYWPRPPDCLMILAFALGLAGDGFAVGDLRRAGAGIDFKFALEAVNNDFQVQFAHAGNDKLAGFLVGEAAEGRVFLRQTLQAFAQFLLVRLGFRLDGHADDRFGEGGRKERDIEFLVAQACRPW